MEKAECFICKKNVPLDDIEIGSVVICASGESQDVNQYDFCFKCASKTTVVELMQMVVDRENRDAELSQGESQ